MLATRVKRWDMVGQNGKNSTVAIIKRWVRKHSPKVPFPS